MQPFAEIRVTFQGRFDAGNPDVHLFDFRDQPPQIPPDNAHARVERGQQKSFTADRYVHAGSPAGSGSGFGAGGVSTKAGFSTIGVSSSRGIEENL